ncbi:uncharacterized protein LOC135498240 [Lineus longissimus]|uniref:uncharacterized protein LOC135498240 n=1 Tax=Lineus longissimus TaxID=88925 RepID=UPI002B4CCD8F
MKQIAVVVCALAFAAVEAAFPFPNWDLDFCPIVESDSPWKYTFYPEAERSAITVYLTGCRDGPCTEEGAKRVFPDNAKLAGRLWDMIQGRKSVPLNDPSWCCYKNESGKRVCPGE